MSAIPKGNFCQCGSQAGLEGPGFYAQSLHIHSPVPVMWCRPVLTVFLHPAGDVRQAAVVSSRKPLFLVCTLKLVAPCSSFWIVWLLSNGNRLRCAVNVKHTLDLVPK